MGQPSRLCRLPRPQGPGRTGGSETSQYPEEQKSNEISSVAASERETAQKSARPQPKCLERHGAAGDTPVGEGTALMSASRAGHVKSCLKTGGPSSKAKYYLATDSEPVP